MLTLATPCPSSYSTLIRRYLEFSGFQVRHVMNFTDVDDKIINRAGPAARIPCNWPKASSNVFKSICCS